MECKRAVATATTVVLALVVVSVAYLFRPTQAALLSPETMCSGRVDKKPGESFTVEIALKNRGSADGVWNVTVAFEGEEWTWAGETKRLTLEPNEKKTLTWEGAVPTDVSVGSIARLIVYYGNEYAALNWWIHVVPGAELHIIDSRVS